MRRRSGWFALLGLLLSAGPARPGDVASFACAPEYREAEARLAEAEARLEDARSRSLLELRGSYFYYPDPNLEGEDGDLTDVRQRARVYLRYPLWERLHRDERLDRLELEVAAARQDLEAVARRLGARAAALRSRVARARDQARRARELARAGVRARHLAKLRELWRDKVLLLEDVLAAERDLARADAEVARWDAKVRSAEAELAGLVCGAGQADPPLEPVVFPAEACDEPVAGPEAELLRARAEEARARQGRNVRLDLEAGYTWEEDANAGLQGGSLWGLRFVVPLGGREYARRTALARSRAWEARAAGAARRAREDRERAWAQVELLAREARVAEAEEALARERRRTRALRGEPPGAPAESRAARRWEVYYEALEIHARLFPDGPPACDAPPRAVFNPPGAGPGTRKAPPRGVYVWGGPAALGDPGDAAAFFLAKGVDRVYLSPGRAALDPSSPAWRHALAALHRTGVRVYLLLAENGWAVPGAGAGLRARLDAFERFQASAAEPFDGLHLDVEPHALPGWPDRPETLLDGLVAVFETARARVDALTEPVPLGASLPLWVAARAGPDRAARAAVLLDEVVLMAYGRPPAPRVRLAAAAWRLARAWPAVNAREFGREGEMEREIGRLARAWPGAPRVVIHDLAAWRRVARAVTTE